MSRRTSENQKTPPARSLRPRASIFASRRSNRKRLGRLPLVVGEPLLGCRQRGVDDPLAVADHLAGEPSRLDRLDRQAGRGLVARERQLLVEQLAHRRLGSLVFLAGDLGDHRFQFVQRTDVVRQRRTRRRRFGTLALELSDANRQRTVALTDEARPDALPVGMRRRTLDTDHLVVDQDDRADLPRHALELGDELVQLLAGSA